MAKVTALKSVKASLVADKLGNLRATIKLLNDEAKDLEKTLMDQGVKVVEGRIFVATIVESVRKIVDWQKIANDLGASKQKISANTRKFPVKAVKVTAHKK